PAALCSGRRDLGVGCDVDRRPCGRAGRFAPRLRSLAPMSASGYLLFISKPTGYELRERQGDLPGVGQEIEEDGGRLQVSKIGPYGVSCWRSSGATTYQAVPPRRAISWTRPCSAQSSASTAISSPLSSKTRASCP